MGGAGDLRQVVQGLRCDRPLLSPRSPIPLSAGAGVGTPGSDVAPVRPSPRAGDVDLVVILWRAGLRVQRP